MLPSPSGKKMGEEVVFRPMRRLLSRRSYEVGRAWTSRAAPQGWSYSRRYPSYRNLKPMVPYLLGFLSSFSDDPGSGLVEVLAHRSLFLILRGAARCFLFQLVCFPLRFIDFCSLVCHADLIPQSNFLSLLIEPTAACLRYHGR